MTCSPWRQLTDWFLALKTLDPEMDRTTQTFRPMLDDNLGYFAGNIRKTWNLAKSFRDASPGFYRQVAKPTLAWATWLELPGQAKPNWLCLTKSEFSMTPSGALDGICFHESCYFKQERHFLFCLFAKKMNDNGSDTWNFTQASWVRIKTFIIHSKQKGWDQKHR